MQYAQSNPPPNPTKDPIQVFSALFTDISGRIELRALPTKDRIFAKNMDEIRGFIKKHYKENFYFGVATRDGAGYTPILTNLSSKKGDMSLHE